MMEWSFIHAVRNLQKLLTLEHVEVMQFTGLLDKNGKEIYEGDILNLESIGFITNEKGEKVNYEVKIDGCDYILYRNDINLKWGRLSRIEEMLWDCYVAGNIYESQSNKKEV